ncbi:MAG: hypothetical protein LV481_12610 [Methylacidiphilales bacterium]|nr:hypothetical protein [Candidatus Methylacidiphilales bacterium]
MRIRLFTLSLLLSLSMATSAWARLGETMDQCVARWGQPVPSADFPPPGYEGDGFANFATFQKGDYHIIVGFLNGVVAVEIITKQESSDLSDNEKAAILEADSAGLAWIKSTTPGANEIWTRNDGAIASYDTFNHGMTIKSKEYRAAEEAKAAADEKAKLKIKDF